MEAFLVSTGIVAFAEIGDKTQLLARPRRALSPAAPVAAAIFALVGALALAGLRLA